MLQVHDLAVSRGGLTVLEGLGFALGPSDLLVLRGPNGVGKTTVLSTLAGLQPALRGQILANPDQITYSGHADGIKATLTVGENLGFWAAVHGHSAIDPAISAMNLTALRSRRAADLSAGQKRRLGLARLLVTGRCGRGRSCPRRSVAVGARESPQTRGGTNSNDGGWDTAGEPPLRGEGIKKAAR